MSSPRLTTNLDPRIPYGTGDCQLLRQRLRSVDQHLSCLGEKPTMSTPEHGCAHLLGETGRPDSLQSTNCVLQQ